MQTRIEYCYESFIQSNLHLYFQPKDERKSYYEQDKETAKLVGPEELLRILWDIQTRVFTHESLYKISYGEHAYNELASKSNGKTPLEHLEADLTEARNALAGPKLTRDRAYSDFEISYDSECKEERAKDACLASFPDKKPPTSWHRYLSDFFKPKSNVESEQSAKIIESEPTSRERCGCF